MTTFCRSAIRGWCTAISGFGAAGPLGGLPGYDAVLQAMSGLMSINGTPDSGHTRIGIPIVDYVTGYNALTGILLALAARQQTGKGQRIDVTLFAPRSACSSRTRRGRSRATISESCFRFPLSEAQRCSSPPTRPRARWRPPRSSPSAR